jgi:hypothetical protein
MNPGCVMMTFLTLALLGSAWAQDTGVNPCDRWGRIDPEETTIGVVGGEVLRFNVLGGECQGVDPDTCDWFMDPNDGSMGTLSTTQGESIQWRTPQSINVCPPGLVTLEVQCDTPDGGSTLDYETLTVDDPNNLCSPSGGGCISPRVRGAWVLFPLLFLGGFRRRS